MLKVQLLGKFDVSLNGRSLIISSRPAQSLLAYLILNSGKLYRRERVAGLLWPDSGEKQARHNLRQTLWRLRQSIGDDYLVTDKVSIGFNSHAEYILDADVLQKQNDSSDTLIQSVSVYEDVLLPGFYDEWVLLEQERLQAIFEDRMRTLLDKLIHEARWRETCEWAEYWLARGQMPEAAYRALMMAHAGLGDQANVKNDFQRCATALEKELGVEPSLETENLFHSLISGQIMPQTQPPTARPPVKLPVQPTPFIGRADDLSRLDILLADSTTRLVTILGAGGIGKTRLAIEAARRQADAFADGVYFVSLAAVDDPTLIITPIATAIDFAFHVRDQREKWERELQNEQLLAYLRDKQMLLVLDNLEHLLEGIPLLAEILQCACDVKMLATSRERLGLRGETIYTVGGLRVPQQINPDLAITATDHDALQLFVNCAERVQPGFRLTVDNINDVITVCQLVDGLPLGIELAAAWIGLLTPAEIATEIKTSLDFLSANWRDMPDRQQSIRSVFESSWKRLTDGEQELFQQLSVFRGGFTRLAAQSITGATLPTLMSLVNKSLVRPDFTGRYYIHELLRQFGIERLTTAPNDETMTRDRHCDYFTAFVKEREGDLNGRNQHQALTEIEVEIDNIHRAWQWAISQDKLQAISDAMEGLCEFHRIRGFYEEYLFPTTAVALGWAGLSDKVEDLDQDTMYNELITCLNNAKPDRSDATTKDVIRAKVLARAARFHCESPRNDWLACYGRRDAMQGLSEIGARQEMAYLLRYLAHLWFTPQQVRHLYQQALTIFQEFNDQRGMAETAYRLGMVATKLGEFHNAKNLFADSRETLQALGRLDTIATCLSELGFTLWALGDYKQAEIECKAGLAAANSVNYRSNVAATQNYLALIKMSNHKYEAAHELLQNSLSIFREIGLRGMEAETAGQLAQLMAVSGQLLNAKEMAQKSLTMCQELDHQVGLIRPLTVLGEVSLGLGEFQAAESYFHEAVQTAVATWMIPYAHHALVGLAHLRAEQGANQQALNIISFIRQQSASWHWSKISLDSLRDKLALQVSEEEITAAQLWGKKKNLEQLIASLDIKRTLLDNKEIINEPTYF